MLLLVFPLVVVHDVDVCCNKFCFSTLNDDSQSVVVRCLRPPNDDVALFGGSKETQSSADAAVTASGKNVRRTEAEAAQALKTDMDRNMTTTEKEER